jgi:hypothetical protein
MKPLYLTVLALGLGAGESLRTDYGRDRSLTVSVVSSSQTEVTRNEMLRDGEPVEGRGGFGGGGSSSERSYSYTDTVLAVKDGAPTKVKRAFGDVGGTATRPGRDGDVEQELESAFSGAIVVIDATGEETKIEVVEGELTDEQVAGLVPTLALDRLLPDGEVEAGKSWELSGEDFLAAVGDGFERQLFRRPMPAEGGEGRGPGGRGQGGRGMGGMGGGLSVLAQGEWDAKATLADETEEVDGVTVQVIELEAEVTGELPEPAMGGGRRGRAFGLAEVPRANTFEAKLEGRLLWSKAEARPVRLELKGKVTTETHTEREIPDGGSFEMHREQETNVEMTVEVTAGPKGE